MRRSVAYLAGPVILIGVTIVVLGLTHIGNGVSASSSAPPPPGRLASPPPGPDPSLKTVSNWPGSPAIRPDRVAGSVGPLSPAFTLADVQQYIAAHGSLHGVGNQPPIVTAFQCLHPAGVTKITHTQIPGRSANDLICLATLSGHFEVAGPPSSSTIGTGTLSWELFDGRTGNLMGDVVKVSGSRPRG